VVGGNGADTIYGQGGNDLLIAGHGGGAVVGGNGNDTLSGSSGNESLYGGNGNELLMGGTGRHELLVGGSGNDTLLAGTGNDTLIGGSQRSVARRFRRNAHAVRLTAWARRTNTLCNRSGPRPRCAHPSKYRLDTSVLTEAIGHDETVVQPLRWTRRARLASART
jgi:hypothetical protein